MDDMTGYQLVPTSSWMPQAACKGLDPELFFPSKGEHPAEAQTICTTCPVTQQCAEYAQYLGQKHGIWGGQSTRQRRRKGRPETPKKLPAAHGTTTRYARGCRCDRCTETHTAHHHERQHR